MKSVRWSLSINCYNLSLSNVDILYIIHTHKINKQQIMIVLWHSIYKAGRGICETFLGSWTSHPHDLLISAPKLLLFVCSLPVFLFATTSLAKWLNHRSTCWQGLIGPPITILWIQWRLRLFLMWRVFGCVPYWILIGFVRMNGVSISIFLLNCRWCILHQTVRFSVVEGASVVRLPYPTWSKPSFLCSECFECRCWRSLAPDVETSALAFIFALLDC